ncbi:MAG: 50S ribosomal protein L4 [Gammaproteobacteria bacterium]|nr:50S ribosomal protein L4 [Gammaproteobacteria bacterium]
MKVTLTTDSGSASKNSVELSDVVFGREFNEPMIHQVVTAFLAGGRAGSRAHKSRSDVRGGGIKPWRQKGTGRARAGTSRSPIWRGGGKTFASKPANYSQKVNKKVYRGAMQSILSELFRQERLIVVADFELAAPKTKDLVSKLAAFGLNTKVLIIAKEASDNLYLSARNLIKVEVRDANDVDPVCLLKYEKVLITADALKQVEGTLV